MNEKETTHVIVLMSILMNSNYTMFHKCLHPLMVLTYRQQTTKSMIFDASKATDKINDI